MRNLFTKLIAAVGLLALASTASAQAPAPSAAYTGPRFPGGPDSLRALVQRSIRTATGSPAPSGRMLVQFELKANGQPHNYTMVLPPAPLNKPLVNATAAALNYLEAHMPAWTPGTPDPKLAPGAEPKVSLAIDFTTAPAAMPYYYADEDPTFGTLANLLQAQGSKSSNQPVADPAEKALLASPKGLARYIQRQVKYPPAALRGQQQGVVYAYFEVAESGAIEHPEILGSAGRTLDAEVLKSLNTLPTATSPAKLKNQPAHVYYVVPVTFRMQVATRFR
ncbi:energy transducer TonB [Hymenobacter humi]|uniref:Energy transducer TonB n=1 Tax=Hymenobacter humi TaxID=1411620 RepID=A0ABW2U086_9BACT